MHDTHSVVRFNTCCLITLATPMIAHILPCSVQLPYYTAKKVTLFSMKKLQDSYIEEIKFPWSEEWFQSTYRGMSLKIVVISFVKYTTCLYRVFLALVHNVLSCTWHVHLVWFLLRTVVLLSHHIENITFTWNPLQKKQLIQFKKLLKTLNCVV